MDVVDLVADLGGVARRSVIQKVVPRADLDRAVAGGLLVRDARGLYVLPGVDDARRAAARLGGVLCGPSAALLHGWGVKTAPDRPHVLVSRGRRVPPRERHRVHLHRGDGVPHEDGVVVAEVALEQCLRWLPFDEALCVADSALREGMAPGVLARLADGAGPGARSLARVCALASPLAANPFESTLRAICAGVPGLQVVPQVVIAGLGVRPDLVDERLRIVLEADSFEWHGGRAALAADARRYNLLVVEGWLVLRFSYEEVMGEPDRVQEVLRQAVALAEVLRERGRRRGGAA
ncbi:hypothetical protein I601_1992 [Nocardioides dokdonensis FR1436]|uniref:DUF559 domain-containing protein n=1 Tax=Nocardioides dokdonensis FR1436 TaxID=1300347 RepID=A0A1A9GL62_9ACTN|nr:DUF559 domain-containing protein [Nocardioides dokdonensis]ANH38420.1 hypothetical protein I601_1992 [Nocardioides dokdonensis FR1436]